jgi:proliferating cell nuclear antigen
MKLMDIDSDSLGIPDTDYDARVTMPSSELTRIVRDLSQLGEAVRIEVSKDGVRFVSDGEAANGSVLLKQTEAAARRFANYGADAENGDGDAEKDGEDEDGDVKEEEDAPSKKKKKVVKKEPTEGDVEMEEDGEENGEEEFKANSDEDGEEEATATSKKRKAPPKVAPSFCSMVWAIN